MPTTWTQLGSACPATPRGRPHRQYHTLTLVERGADALVGAGRIGTETATEVGPMACPECGCPCDEDPCPTCGAPKPK